MPRADRFFLDDYFAPLKVAALFGLGVVAGAGMLLLLGKGPCGPENRAIHRATEQIQRAMILVARQDSIIKTLLIEQGAPRQGAMTF